MALGRLGGQIGAGQAALFGLMVLAGGAIVYSFWLILTTLSFWFVRVENILVIFQCIYEAGRWPVTLYPAWLRFGLTFLVPVAFAVDRPGRGADRPPDRADRPAGRRAGGGPARRLALVLEDRAAQLLGRLGLSGAPAPACYRLRPDT